MAYQHYIPATYLANFSTDDQEDRRKRNVWVGDKFNATKPIRPSKVEKIGGENHFYSYPTQFAQFNIDSLWKYEGNLYNAIEKLITGNVDADTWLKTLIPFVVCLFIRSKDFEKRFNNRTLSLGLKDEYFYNNKSYIGQGSLIELQRLLCPVLTSTWNVLHIQGDDNLIVNDIGFIPYKNYLVFDQGFAIPLDRRHILALATKRKGILFHKIDENWIPNIEHHTLPMNNHNSFNHLLASYSNRFIIGDSEELVQKYLTTENSHFTGLEPFSLFKFSGRELAAYEFSWHRLVSYLDEEKGNPQKLDFEINFESVKKYWEIPIILPANLMDFPSIFVRKGDEVLFDCYDTDQYFDFCEIRNYFDMGLFVDVIKMYRKFSYSIKDKVLRQEIFKFRQLALIELGKPKLSLIEITLSSIKRDNFFYFQRSQCFVDLKLYKLALKDLHKACKLTIYTDELLLNIGVCFLQLCRFEEAKSIFNFLSISNNETISKIAKINLCTIDFQEDKSLSRIRDLEKIDTSSLPKKIRVNVLINILQILFLSEDYSKIPKIINTLKEIDPNNPIVTSVEAQYAEATNNEKKYLHTSSVLLKNKLTRLKSASILFNRGLIYYHKNELNLALQEIKRAIRKNFFYFEYHAQKANILLLMGKYKYAIMENIIAFLLSHNDGRVLNSLGLIFFTIGKDNTAICFFRYAIKLLKQNVEIVRPYRNLLRSYIELGKISEADQLINKIKDIRHDSPETKLVLAQYYISKNDIQKAEECLSGLIKNKAAKQDVMILNLLICLKKNNKNEIEKALSRINTKKFDNSILKRYQRELVENEIFLKTP